MKIGFSKTTALAAFALPAMLLAAGCETVMLGGGDKETDVAEKSAGPMSLEDVLAARSEEDRARDAWRNPAETLAFFGVESDDFVIEALPGTGWYTRVLLPYVAAEGKYAGANYQDGMWPLILPDPTPELIERLSTWADNFPEKAAAIAATDEPVVAYEFGDAPDELKGTADVALFIRALHNFSRAGGSFGADAMAETYDMLKPGGVLGVVQHSAPEGATGASADGSVGYMSVENVVAMAEAAGFVFEEASDINANSADQPNEGEIVWRLPPTYAFGDDNRDAYTAIGESNRMTLRFRKPVE